MNDTRISEQDENQIPEESASKFSHSLLPPPLQTFFPPVHSGTGNWNFDKTDSFTHNSPDMSLVKITDNSNNAADYDIPGDSVTNKRPYSDYPASPSERKRTRHTLAESTWRNVLPDLDTTRFQPFCDFKNPFTFRSTLTSESSFTQFEDDSEDMETVDFYTNRKHEQEEEDKALAALMQAHIDQENWDRERWNQDQIEKDEAYARQLANEPDTSPEVLISSAAAAQPLPLPLPVADWQYENDATIVQQLGFDTSTSSFSSGSKSSFEMSNDDCYPVLNEGLQLSTSPYWLPSVISDIEKIKYDTSTSSSTLFSPSSYFPQQALETSIEQLPQLPQLPPIESGDIFPISSSSQLNQLNILPPPVQTENFHSTIPDLQPIKQDSIPFKQNDFTAEPATTKAINDPPIPICISDDESDDEPTTTTTLNTNFARPSASKMTTEEQCRALLDELEETETLQTQVNSRIGTPENLIPTLMPHQVHGLNWLIVKEESTNRGGILADGMGLGKTIQSIALILARPSTIKGRRSTLIVTPLSLMHQWAEEFMTKTRGLKVFLHHGKNRLRSVNDIQAYDVVITTYTTIASENQSIRQTALFKTKWHRIILDEAQYIKNKRTNSAKGCFELDSTYRWCLSGTPIQNGVDEVYSLLKFLRIQPYCEWDEFRDFFIKPYNRRAGGGEIACKRLQIVLKTILLRRNKSSIIDGRPIIELPARDVHITETPFTDDEREFYTHLENRSRLQFNRYLREGSVMKNYSNILLLLLRLRQACCHPFLIKDRNVDDDGQGNPAAPSSSGQNNPESLLDRMAEEIVNRLKEQDLEFKECPICYDSAVDLSILIQCGHSYCRECLQGLFTPSQSTNKCPECRGQFSMNQVVSVSQFKKRWIPDFEETSDKAKGKEKVDDDLEEVDEIEEDFPLRPNDSDDWVPSSKLDKTISLLQDFRTRSPQDKTIIFSQFTTLLDYLEHPLKENGFTFVRYDGKIDHALRNERIQEFNRDPSITVMLVSLKCGGVGLNLTAANRVIMLDPWWNPAMENQAIDRVHRIGQDKAVEVHRIIIPNTIENRILELQSKKEQLAQRALGEGGAAPLGRLGLNDLMYLFRG